METPASSEDFISEPSDTTIDMPTLGAFHLYQNNAELSDRRLIAIEIGSAELNWPYLRNTTRVFSRRLLKDIFDEESRAMDTLLTDCRKIETLEGFAFTVKRENCSPILSMLLKVKQKIADILLAGGTPVPALPIWGSNGDVDLTTPLIAEIHLLIKTQHPERETKDLVDLRRMITSQGLSLVTIVPQIHTISVMAQHVQLKLGNFSKQQAVHQRPGCEIHLKMNLTQPDRKTAIEMHLCLQRLDKTVINGSTTIPGIMMIQRNKRIADNVMNNQQQQGR
ncbi:hypothetical protein DXG01_002497 [Tephrocybe rancida]|nr:hypothetical protein DXG01_002497 [Tephrocybe rancida]